MKPQTRSTLEPPPSVATSAATAKVEISPPEPPRAAPAPSMSTRHGLSRASSATTSPTTSAATFSWREPASASAERPCAAGYRDWDRREKKTIYASEQNPEARWRFLAWIRGIDPHRLVFVDESGFNVAMTLPYAYAPRGQRAVGRVPKNRGENTSLVAAISLDEGVGDAMTLTGAVDGVAFLAYIEQVIAPKLRPGQIVVMDQLGVHRKPEVREAIEARGCELVLLPGYSPDFNPIELAFSKIKAFVKAVGARTRGALDSAIAAALSTVSLGDVLGWFEHAGVTNHSGNRSAAPLRTCPEEACCHRSPF